MCKFLTVLAMAAFTSLQALASVSVSIGINIPVYPDLQRIPGYPVYYVPRLQANYFFYDGLYWVYVPDGWYVSPWYDGPWERVAIDSVPLFVLRIPLRYYGSPPMTFRHWTMNAPPRWDAVWGPDWTRRHHDWKRWNRAAAPAPAPLPSYQQRYSRDNYPDDAQQRELVQQHYRYAPRDTHARQQWQTQVGDVAHRPPARRNAAQQTQMPSTQVRDMRANEPRSAERAEAPANRQAPPRRAPPMPQPEPPRRQAEAPHAGPVDHGPAPNARSGHGGRPDKPDRPDRPDRPSKGDKEDKGDRGDHHESGKHR